jgi:hypothetical protein
MGGQDLQILFIQRHKLQHIHGPHRLPVMFKTTAQHRIQIGDTGDSRSNFAQ